MKSSLSNDQKLVFELLFLYHSLLQKVGLKGDDLEYPSYLPDVETAKRILSEREAFEYAAYKSLLKDLPEEDKEVETISTCHKQFKTPFVSKHTFGSDNIKMKFYDKNQIDPMNTLHVTKDLEGKEVLLKLSSDDLKRDKATFFNYVYQNQNHRRGMFKCST